MDLPCAADTRRPDARTSGQRFETTGLLADQYIRGRRPLQHRRDLQALRIVPGQILETVHRHINGSAKQCILEFLCEESLSARFARAEQRKIELLVPARDEYLPLHGQPRKGRRKGVFR